MDKIKGRDVMRALVQQRDLLRCIMRAIIDCSNLCTI